MSNIKTSNAAGGPPAAAAALVERHAAALRSYLLLLPGADAARADGVSREVLAEAQATGGAEFEEDPAVWLFARGRKRMIGAGSRGDPLGAGAGGRGAEDEPAAEGEDPRVVVHRAFERLTPKQQESLRLKFQFGFGLDELARITALTRSGAGSLLHHAVERIGQALGGHEPAARSLAGDFRLTAYALDELERAERRTFEEGAPNGRVLLEASEKIRGWCAQIARVLESGAPLPSRRRKRRGGPWWTAKGTWFALGGLGAIVAGAVVLWPDAPAAEAARARQADRSKESPVAVRNAPAEAPTVAGGRTADRGGASRGSRDGIGFERIGAVNPTATGSAAGNPSTAHGGSGGVGAGPTFSGFGAGGSGAPGQAGRKPGAATGGDSAAPTASGRGQAGDGPAPASEPTERQGGEGGATPAEASSSPAVASPASLPRPRRLAMSPSGRTVAPGAPDVEEAVDESARDFATVPKLAEGRHTAERPPQNLAEMRRQLARRQWPAPETVNVGEMLRQVPAADPLPETAEPVQAKVELVRSPWDARKRLVRVALQAKEAPVPARPRANLVLAIDVSESMAGANRLPLVQEAVRRLVDRLRPDDQVTIVTYAERAQLALAATPAGRAGDVRACLAGLETAGLTNGADGLLEAYRQAHRQWIEGGLNTVVLCTDGNFNLGTTNEEALAAGAEEEARRGVRLSVFGFGRSDRNDLRLELLASRGGGRSCYVNTQIEAERLLVEQLDGLLTPVAEAVRLRVAFNPERVTGLRRLGGDEAAEDSAGEVSADLLLPGSRLSALFEYAPKDGEAEGGAGLAEVTFDYVEVATDVPRRQGQVLAGGATDWVRTGTEFRSAVAMAELGRILQAGPPKDVAEIDRFEDWVRANLPEDAGGYRAELLSVVGQARLAAAALRMGAPGGRED